MNSEWYSYSKYIGVGLGSLFFKKIVLHKLQIQVSLPLLKLTREIPLYKEKGNLIHIYAMAIFNLSKISLQRISRVGCICRIRLSAFN